MASVKRARTEPRKPAQQARSRARLEAIFEAMDRVLEQEGVEDFGVATVARAAGVPKASIYDYFPTREALVAAWEERIIEKEMARLGPRVVEMVLHPPTIEESITELVDIGMDAFARQARVFRYGERLDLSARPAVTGRVSDRIVDLIRMGLEMAPDRARLRIERFDVAARLVVHSVLALATALAATTMSPEEELLHRRELSRMIALYLLRDPVV